MTSTAFFDLDNTVVRGSSLFHFGRYAVARGFLSRRELLRFAKEEAEFAIRRTEAEGAPASIAARVLGIVRGRRADDLERLAHEFAAHHLSRRLVKPVIGEMRFFHAVGVPTYLVTASPQEVANAVAVRLGMSGALGTTSEIVDGRYTGRLAGPIMHGSQKAYQVAEFAAGRSLDLSRSWAYSDSINDLSLLASVQVPVVVNPNRQLETLALRNGWRVIGGRRPPTPRPTPPPRQRVRAST
jgi:HAD superfamily hydrolase (TIGR01490 family)